MLSYFDQCKYIVKGPINMCTNFEISRYIIFRFKSYGSNSGFNVLDDLNL